MQLTKILQTWWKSNYVLHQAEILKEKPVDKSKVTGSSGFFQ